jgi:hypothetical protein
MVTKEGSIAGAGELLQLTPEPISGQLRLLEQVEIVGRSEELQSPSSARLRPPAAVTINPRRAV